MRHLFVLLVLFLVFGWVLIGCGTDRQEPGPEDSAKEWIDAIVNQDGNRILKYTCREHRDDVKEAGMWISAFAVLGQLLTNRSVQIEGDISDLKFETVSQSDDQAEVRVYGELRAAVLANASAYDVDERWKMIKEDDTWRWCNPNLSALSLKPTKTPTVKIARVTPTHTLPPLEPTNTPTVEITQVTPTHTLPPPTSTPDIQATSSPTEEPSSQETKDSSSNLEEQIIGTWQFRMEDQGGFEVRFLEDGSAEFNSIDPQGQVLPGCTGVYSLNGSQLTYEMTGGVEDSCSTGVKRVVKVELLGDVLLHIDEHGSEIPLIRVSADQEVVETIQQFSERMKKDIIGTWQIKLRDGGTIEYQFSDDGKLEWRVIDARERLMFTVKGKYTLNFQTLVFEFTEVPDEITVKKEQAFTVIVSGDSLYFRGSSSQEWMEAIRVSAN